MRTFNMRGSVVAVLFCTVIALFVIPAQAVGQASDTEEFETPISAYRQGVSAYESGRADPAIRAFEYASEAGILGAQLRLARMYARGDLVAQDDGNAFKYYKLIVKGFANLDASHAGAKYVAEAYVAVGRYYEKGMPDVGVDPDPVKAGRFYRHAAGYFGDPVAQFKLARLYLKDTGIERNIAVAAKWLHSAAKKSHAPSQAVLAELLWAGGDVEKRVVQSLALIDLALSNAKGPEREWIADLHQRMFDKSRDADKNKARLILAEWRTRSSAGATKVATSEKREELPHNSALLSASLTLHPDPVSVILGTPGTAEGFDADAIFGAATQIEVPGFNADDTPSVINVGASEIRR